MAIKSTEEFIALAKARHGNTYSYTETVYKNSTTKIQIICPQHGMFEQVPYSHLRGNGCNKCAQEQKIGMTTEQFIQKAQVVHGDEYDYQNTVYTSRHKKVKITCRHHGVFEQLAGNHLNGSGCQKCYGKNIAHTNESFIEKAKEVHGDEYEYSLVDYTGNHNKVKIICQKHGMFEQQAGHHMRGHGCPYCGYGKGGNPNGNPQDMSKARRTMLEKYGTANPLQVPEFYEKAKATWQANYGTSHPMSAQPVKDKNAATWRSKTPDEYDRIHHKKIEAYLEKYGVDNPSRSPIVLAKIATARINNGEWTDPSLKDPWRRYCDLVTSLTNKSFRDHYYKINPDRLPRNRENHLDHIFSKAEGFRNGVPPEIIAHWTNLQMLPASKNQSKMTQCGKTLEQLYEDYRVSISHTTVSSDDHSNQEFSSGDVIFVNVLLSC
jgi:hypothetical protein